MIKKHDEKRKSLWNSGGQAEVRVIVMIRMVPYCTSAFTWSLLIAPCHS